jgi:hypothetical protein
MNFIMSWWSDMSSIIRFHLWILLCLDEVICQSIIPKNPATTLPHYLRNKIPGNSAINNTIAKKAATEATERACLIQSQEGRAVYLWWADLALPCRARWGHRCRATEDRTPKPKKLELKLKKPNCISVNSIQKPQFNSVFDFYFGLNWKTETVLISVLVQRPNPIQLKNMGQGNPTSNPKCI